MGVRPPENLCPKQNLNAYPNTSLIKPLFLNNPDISVDRNATLWHMGGVFKQGGISEIIG